MLTKIFLYKRYFSSYSDKAFVDFMSTLWNKTTHNMLWSADQNF